jgi:hypothetical protein
MFNKIALFVTAMTVAVGTAFAQMPCGTDDQYHALIEQYPQLAEFEKQFNEQVSARLGRSTALAADTSFFDVPLVLHIVHDYGVENISDNELYDAVAHWATIYLAENPDTALVIPTFKPYIGNAKIRLHLATIDPGGNPTKGIVRHNSYLTTNADDQAKISQWPNNKYINIWFINKFGASASGAAAYAIYPSTADYMPHYDGIISLASYVDYAKVIPHELGHVLNLAHTWGSTNNPNVACGDDGVDDTPPTKGHTPVGCTLAALYDVTCASGNLEHYTSVSGADSIFDYPDTVNSENIMDYTYCQKMFTKGQVYRMRQALTGSAGGRSNLITSANLAATGAMAPMPDLAPVADFVMNKASSSGLVTDLRSYFLTFNNPASFVFRNASWNDTLSGVSWEFSNGATTPASTNTGTVNNQFSVPGWVTVTLTATSNAGSNTVVRPNAVYAADTAATSPMDYVQQIPNAAALSNWPMFNFYNNEFKWEVYEGAGYGDNTCLRYHSFDNSSRLTSTATGDHDDIYSPAFNLSDISDKFYLNFFTTGASTMKGIGSWDDLAEDSVEISVSISGGTRWAKIGSVAGNNLANAGQKNSEYIPTASNTWRGQAISIPVAYRAANTFFRFRYWPGNKGNNLYIDNLYFYPYPVGVKESLQDASNTSNLFPNPANNGCTLVFKTGSDGVVSYCIKDVTGKLIYQATKTYAANSIEQEAISRSQTPNAGMYFITTTIDGVNTTKKLIVY